MSDDLKLLQGTWAVRSLEVEGQPMPPTMLGAARIVIKGKRFTSTGMGPVYKGTLKLDSSTKPPQLDMQFDAGPEKGNVNLGIYECNGDTFKLCLATRGTVRPSKFKSTPGSGFALEILTRGEAIAPKAKTKPTPAPTRSTTPTELEGEWQMVSGVMSGIAMSQSDVQWVKRTMTGNETTVTAGPQVMLKATFMNDPSKSPKTIDYVLAHGPSKGKSQLGIYELDGNLLKVCTAAPGLPRATKFESLQGDGSTLTVWKKMGS
jgi:uncharacterized protein (TIGR03067 family)